MESIVRLTTQQKQALAHVLRRAITDDRSVRIATGTDETGTWVKWDAGCGWTPPYYGEQF